MENDKVATIKLYPADPSKYKEGSNHPKYTGPATVNGDKNFRASAWLQDDKAGNSHISVSIQKKMAPTEGYKTNNNNDVDDQIPF